MSKISVGDRSIILFLIVFGLFGFVTWNIGLVLGSLVVTVLSGAAIGFCGTQIAIMVWRMAE